MTIEEIVQSIKSKYDYSGIYCEMSDDICNGLFSLTNSESEHVTVKEFLLNVLVTERE